MTNELVLKENNEKVNVIDSREVAEMLGKEHKEIMRTIKGDKKTIGMLPTLESGNFPPSDYFIPSTYINSQNKTQPCYLVTKLGCEMLGTRLQGTKGILFTAAYVKRFNEMEKVLQRNVLSFQIEDPIERAKAWIREQEEQRLLLAQKDEIIEELSPLAELARKRIDKTGTFSLTDVTKTAGLKRGQITVWAKTNGYIHKSICEVNAKGEEYFKIVCTDGEHKNMAITEEGLRLIDKNIEEIKKSPCSFESKKKKKKTQE